MNHHRFKKEERPKTNRRTVRFRWDFCYKLPYNKTTNIEQHQLDVLKCDSYEPIENKTN